MQPVFDCITVVSAFFVAIEPLIYYVYRKRNPHGERLRGLHVRLLGLFAASAAASAVTHASPTSLLPVLDGVGIPLVFGAAGYLFGRGVRWALHRALSRYPHLLSSSVGSVLRLRSRPVA